MEVPSSGIAGIFGSTEKKCFDIKIPAQIISNALTAGGKENYFILESELESLKVIKINMQSLPLPQTLEDLQKNYLLFDERGLDISLV